VAIVGVIFGQFWPMTRTGPPNYCQYMLSTFLVIGAVLVGLLLLLVLIVSLSARPATRAQGNAVAPRTWVNDAGRAHPDAWSPMTTTSTNEIRAIS
jgi:hypothetical protein